MKWDQLCDDPALEKIPYGAGEFWVCDRKGDLEFFGPRARLAKSRLCPKFPCRIAS